MKNDDAIEVRYDGKLVGWLNDFNGVTVEEHISLRIESKDLHSFSVHKFNIQVFNQRISDAEILDKHRSVAAREPLDIPDYAICLQEPQHHATRYSWAAINLTQLTEYELIFDYLHFVPSDTEPDVELAKNEFTPEAKTAATFTWVK